MNNIVAEEVLATMHSYIGVHPSLILASAIAGIFAYAETAGLTPSDMGALMGDVGEMLVADEHNWVERKTIRPQGGMN